MPRRPIEWGWLGFLLLYLALGVGLLWLIIKMLESF